MGKGRAPCSSSFLPTYSSATNRIASLPGFTPSYDANGNLVNDGAHTYAWDAAGNLIGIDSTTKTFDALGRLVEINRGGSYQEVAYSRSGGKLAVMAGQSIVRAYVPLPAGATAVYGSGGVLSYYRHPDWLGSSRFASTPSRTMYYAGAYAPFGESYAEAGTTDRSFTGQNQDTVPGLNDFLYREHSPTQGRWLSPDPYMGSMGLTNPQSLNRYAYVLNNPLNAVDPSGLDPYMNEVPTDTCGGDTFLACEDARNSGGAGGPGGSGGCYFMGMAAPCSVVNSAIAGGAAAVCPAGGCNQLRTDPDTGDWEQVSGWKNRNVLGPGGTITSQWVPIWTDYDPRTALVFGAGPGQLPPGANPWAQAMKQAARGFPKPSPPPATSPGAPVPEPTIENPIPWWMRLLEMLAGAADSAGPFVRNISPPVYIPPDLRCEVGEKQYCAGHGGPI